MHFKPEFYLIGFLIIILAVYANANSKNTFQIKLSKDQLKESCVRLHVFTSRGLNKTFTIDYQNKTSDRLETICDKKEKKLIKFIVHGFAETWNMTYRWNWVDNMIKEMLKSPEASKLCIVVLDWKELANGGSELFSNYWKAISNMQISGDLVTEFLHINQVDPSRMHCIGFSLGAHMCSIFYKIYYQKFKVLPARITGLDPAGPFFEEKPLEEKLNYQDAALVDIIHTSENFGLASNLGHMDFYQDGGASNIKACDKFADRVNNFDNVVIYEEENHGDKTFEDVHLDSQEKADFFSLGTVKTGLSKAKSMWKKVKSWFLKSPKRVFLKAHQFFGCSHIMAVRYFIYSINTCTYSAVPCPDLAHFLNASCAKNVGPSPRMGYYADLEADRYKTSRNKLFIHTSEKPPYCLDPLVVKWQ